MSTNLGSEHTAFVCFVETIQKTIVVRPLEEISEVRTLSMRPERVRHGIGSQILRQRLTNARELGIKRVL